MKRKSPSHDPTAPAQLMERLSRNWQQRLAVGVSIGNDFQSVESALVLTKGAGKFLHHQWSSSHSLPLPTALGQGLRDLVDQPHPTLTDLSQTQIDLSQLIGQAVATAMAQSGRAHHKVLTVGIVEPGIWTTDFDETRRYFPLCDSDRVAERTGLTVIHSFPSRDLAASGSGLPCDMIATWLLLADRDPRISRRYVLALQDSEAFQAVLLPPSDGLDEDLPDIQRLQLDADSATTCLADAARRVARFVDRHVGNVNTPPIWLVRRSQSDRLPELAKALVEQAPHRYELKADPADGMLANYAEAADATIAGLLGLMALDQLPATIPWINGSCRPRVLGQITPGNPANWRQIILSMADYRPPAMRLRDAI